MDLIKRLRAAACGQRRWRVADPITGAYCIEFFHEDGVSFSLERECHEWLKDHKKRFPESQFSGYVVTEVVTRNKKDMLMIEASNEIERLLNSSPH